MWEHANQSGALQGNAPFAGANWVLVLSSNKGSFIVHTRAANLRRRFSVAARMAISLLVLAGCSTDSPSETKSTGSLSTFQIQFPVGRNWRTTLSFMPSAKQNELLFNKWQESIRACMAGRGFTYVSAIYYGNGQIDLRNPLDWDAAERFGYHLAPESDFPQPAPSSDANKPEYATALDAGDNLSSDSCGALGFQSTYGAVAEYTDQVQRLVSDLSSTISGFEGSADGLPIVQSWSACMQRSGYEFASPLDADTTYSGKGEISAQERRVRLADLDCDVGVGLTKSRSAWESARIEQWQAAHETQLVGLKPLKAHFDQIVSAP